MGRYIAILWIICRLILGGVMVNGGINKFKSPNPSPMEVLEKAQKFTDIDQKETLQKILYINGARQTDFFWELLGISEIIFGLLLLIQGTGFVGALFLLPITLQVFLFHLFLEPEEWGELIYTALLLSINIAIVLRDYKLWKHLLWVKPI